MKPIQNIFMTFCLAAVALLLPAWTLAQGINLHCQEDVELCIVNNNCLATINLAYPGDTTDCPQNGLVFTYSGDLGSGTIPIEGVTLSDIGLGTHIVTISAADDCSNTASCNFTIFTYDCEVPVPICINGLAIELMPTEPDTDVDGDGDIDTGAMTVWSSDFIVNPITDCSDPVRYTIHKEEEILSGENIPAPEQTGIVLTCDDFGTVIVRIYVWDSAFNPYAVQPDGTIGGPNYDWCETYILVQDNMFNLCEQNIAISGTILTPSGEPVAGAKVRITGTQSYTLTTNENGQFSQAVLYEGDYTVRPFSNSSFTNGVDTADLSTLLTYTSGNTGVLDSPYKILAGDIDASASVNVNDAILLNQLIDGAIDNFPAPSWRFIRQDYIFPFPDNPFFEPVPELVNLNDLDTSIQVNFIGFKMGDVNHDATLELANLTGVEGRAYLNTVGSCSINSSNPVLKGWGVKVHQGGQTFYTTTDTLGYYRIPLPPGNYQLSLIAPNESWIACQSNVNITVGNTSFLNRNLSAKPQYNCPVPTVDIANPFLRRCFENQFTVSYSNNGVTVLENAFIEITLDPYLEITESTLPWTTVGTDSYAFTLGNLSPGQAGNFQFKCLLSCDALLGQTHCLTAHIFPDSLCLPVNEAWDGSILDLSGFCDDDTLRFRIENLGNDMQQPSRYYVIEDDLIMMTEPILLPGGGAIEINRLGNGATQRVIAEQVAGYPIQSAPTQAIEGCGTNNSGSISIGFVSQFPENEDSPSVSVYCRENIGAYDPNDKHGFPKGVGAQHFIEPGQALDYLVRFQNTGTDTAFTVIIQDTLSPYLDLTTLQIGSASHPYTWQLRNNILIVKFDNILLPDSTTNEAASHGFIAFRIQQHADIPLGSVIHNEAAIYFDFNDPIITNEVMHTVDTGFIDIAVTTKNEEVSQQIPLLLLSPNPLKAGSLFKVGGLLPDDAAVIIYSSVGKQIATLTLKNGGTAILPAELSPGWYLLELRTENQVIGRGKIVIGR